MKLFTMVFSNFVQSCPPTQAPFKSNIWVLSIKVIGGEKMHCYYKIVKYSRYFPSHLSIQHCELFLLFQDHVKIMPLSLTSCHLLLGFTLSPVSKKIMYLFRRHEGEIWHEHQNTMWHLMLYLMDIFF